MSDIAIMVIFGALVLFVPTWWVSSIRGAPPRLRQ